ncbi:MAG: topoisomerase C-terminal repeat-containing protein, partial [Pirellulales bacterium]
KVQLLDGRYGPYLNDGETNASLPKGASVEELTFAEALELLAARAALGPPKKKSRAKSAKAANTAAPKKSATKRRPAKTAAVKSAKKKSGE